MSEVIITAEMKEDAKKCGKTGQFCDDCKMPFATEDNHSLCIEALASLPGVWDEAKPNEGVALVYYKPEDGDPLNGLRMVKHTRTLPKSLEDEIAEKYSFDTPSCHPMINGMRAIEVIKSALKEYNERQGEIKNENEI